MLKAYAIGFFGAVLAVALVAGVWFVTQPKQEPGLVWGGTVYTSKQEFNGYLKEKGLSYRTWLTRNPGVAPWEPDVEPAVAATGSRRTARPATTDDDSTTRLPLVAGLLLATGGALLLLLWLPRPHLPSIPRRSVTFAVPRSLLLRGRAGVPAALTSLRRSGVVALNATRRLKVSVPLRAERLVGAARFEAGHVHKLLRERNISAGDVVFGLIAVMASGLLGLFVVLLASG